MERAFGLLDSFGAAATSEDYDAIKTILASYPPADVIRFLKESLSEKSEPTLRVKAAAVLHQAVGIDAFRLQAEAQIRSLAMAAADDKDWRVVDSALWALGWWNEDPEVLALLKVRLQKETDPQIVSLLFRFFEKRGALLLLEEMDRPIPRLGTKERDQWQTRMALARKVLSSLP